LATYGSGIKIAGVVSAVRSTNGTIYTVPAGNAVFGQVNFSNINGSASINIDGQPYVFANTTLTATGNANIYCGPGQVIALTINSGTVVGCVSGVLFSN
jgi:hypothetical protein